MSTRSFHGSAAPDVSVLMTVYNTAPYLAEAIDSILSQETRRTWELLIVDDGSTDGSLEIAKRYAASWPETIRVLQHPVAANRGISASRNLALDHASAPLLAFLDSDDVWLPHHLEQLSTILHEHPEAAMAYSGAERWVDFAARFDEHSARNSSWGLNYLPPLFPAGERGGLLPPGQLLRWFQSDESLVPCICSVMVRTAAARAVGGFCDAFRGIYDDQPFHARMSLTFPIFALDGCVARYRQHDRSCCALARTQTRATAEEQRRLEAFLKAPFADQAQVAARR